MGEIFIPSRGPCDWCRLLDNPGHQGQSGSSAKAVASSWEAADGLPSEIAKVIGGSPELLLAIPKHKFALPGGIGNSDSKCNVFALVKVSTSGGSKDETMALVVEAKKDEAFGKTIGDWLRGASDGKKERLSYICKFLDLDCHWGSIPPDRLRYQLFHRTAAAIQRAREFKTDSAAMIVQSFSPKNRGFEDFKEFAEFLDMKFQPGGKRAKINLKSGLPLTLGWASRSS